MQIDEETKNIPQKPRSGYLIFLSENRKKTPKDGKAPKEFMKLMAQMWSELDESQKKIYNQKAKQEREIYNEYIKANPFIETAHKEIKELKDDEVHQERILSKPMFSNDKLKNILSESFQVEKINKNVYKLLSKSCENFIKEIIHNSFIEANKIKSNKMSEKILNNSLKKDYRMDFLNDVDGIFENDKLKKNKSNKNINSFFVN